MMRSRLSSKAFAMEGHVSRFIFANCHETGCPTPGYQPSTFNLTASNRLTLSNASFLLMESVLPNDPIPHQSGPTHRLRLPAAPASRTLGAHDLGLWTLDFPRRSNSVQASPTKKT